MRTLTIADNLWLLQSHVPNLERVFKTTRRMQWVWLLEGSRRLQFL